MRKKSEKLKRKIVFYFYSDWKYLMFWRKIIWRGFTFINFEVETDKYDMLFELDIALLGLHFEIVIYRSETQNRTVEEFLRGAR